MELEKPFFDIPEKQLLTKISLQNRFLTFHYPYNFIVMAHIALENFKSLSLQTISMEEYWIVERGLDHNKITAEHKIDVNRLFKKGVGIIYASCEYFNKASVQCNLPDKERIMSVDDITSGICVCTPCKLGIGLIKYQRKVIP